MGRIVHLGLGNFHRAHQAWYTARAGGDWCITGVAMTRPDLRDALAPAGFAYTLAIQGPDGVTRTPMRVHDRVLVLPEDPDAVIRAIADPATHIVTLTVTEKGYGFGHDGQLDLAHPAIAADLAGTTPQSAIGVLTRGLMARAMSGRPITLISCDNIGNNGRKLRAGILRFAQAAGADLGDYMQMRVGCPNTMVDRITPATTDALRREMGEPAPVLTEAFSEWVIEDTFTTPRPDWAAAGAVITQDVAPFEMRKLHLLNAAHSLLAYGGLLRGHSHVHEAMADPVLARAVAGLWDEATAIVPTDIHDTLPAYRRALDARFAVAAMRHRLDQIAMDGSQKMPVRIIPILKARLARDDGAPQAIFAIAAWLAYLARGDIAPDPAAAPLAGGLPEKVMERGLHLLGLSEMSHPCKTDLESCFQRFASHR
jgi:fructuronate reductase